MRSPLKLAFQPPSDMGTIGSGGGGNKTWKILGIGCGIFVLICGLALAFGGYKVASFCGSGINIVKTAMNAQKYAGDFAQEIAKADFDKAYAKMTPRYQQEVSKDMFIEKFSKYKDVIGGTPVARGFNANQTNTKEEYKASYFFPVSTGTEMPTIDFTIVKGGEGDNDFLVDTFKVFLAERNMGNEQPAQIVMQFHDHISKGQDTFAYMNMGDSFRSKTAQEAFDQFLKDAGPTFTTGRWEIQNIKYHTADSATVMAISRSRDGASMLIQFELAKTEKMGIPLWQIEAIAPLAAGDAPTDAKVDDKNPTEEKVDDAVEIPKIDKPEEKPPAKN